MNTVPFSFDVDTAKPTDEGQPNMPVPMQTADGDTYLCGNPGNVYSGVNAGRDQDRSRECECTPATPFARYVG